MRARKSEVVLSSARTLFLQRGYDATTVDEIAGAAHVSKATVYSNFPDKAALLRRLLEQAAEESSAILAALVLPLDEQGPIDERLVRTAVALARGVLRPEVLQLRRLAVAEAPRFPEVVARYYELGPAATLAVLEARFALAAEHGLLSIDDPGCAAARFAYAVVGALQDRALLAGEQPDEAEIVRHATAAAYEFLAAHPAPTAR